MAERRMFAKTVVDSDAFLEMPLSTQALYFHLAMRADDDGFVNAPKRIVKLIEASEEDLNTLIDFRYLLSFASGVIVVRHWKVHNYIQKDRYKETLCTEEKKQLETAGDKGYRYK